MPQHAVAKKHSVKQKLKLSAVAAGVGPECPNETRAIMPSVTMPIPLVVNTCVARKGRIPQNFAWAVSPYPTTSKS